MKAAILAITRDVHLVDITHEIAPHDVLEGALALEAAAPSFPADTIHVAVVDPGVGTARLGPPVSDPVRLPWPEAREARGTIRGAVVHVDRFGNLVTSVGAEALASLGSSVSVRVAGRALRLV